MRAANVDVVLGSFVLDFVSPLSTSLDLIAIII